MNPEEDKLLTGDALKKAILSGQMNMPPDTLDVSAPNTEQSSPSEEKEKPGILGTIGDTVKGAVSGALKEAENTVQTVHDVVDYADEKLSDGSHIDDYDYDFVPEVLKPKTGIGKTAQAISAFATGWFTFGSKIKAGVKGAKVLKNAVPLVQDFVSGVASGAVTDFVTGDSTDERLADVLLENDIMGNAVVDFLSSKPDDSAAEARLKNAAEGFITGTALDGAMKLFRGLKTALKADTKKGLDAALSARASAAKESASEVINEVTGDEDIMADAGLHMTKQAKTQFARQEASKKVDEAFAKVHENGLDDLATEGEPLFNYQKFSEPTREMLYAFDQPLREVIPEDRMNMHVMGETVIDELRSQGTDVFGVDLSLLNQAGDDAQKLVHEAAYWTAATDVVGKYIGEAARAVDEGAEGAPEQLSSMLGRAYEMMIGVHKLQHASGQLLKAHDVLNYIPSEKFDDVLQPLYANPTQAAKEFITSISPEEQLVLARRLNAVRDTGGKTIDVLLQALPDTNPLKKVVKKTSSPWMSFARSYWYNAMLSSPKGRIRDAIISGARTVLLPVEHSIGGMFTGAAQGFKQNGFSGMGLGAFHGAQRGYYYMQGIRDAWRNAAKMAGLAAKNGTSIIRGGNYDMTQGACDIFSYFTGADSVATQGAKMALTTPMRVMAAMDEFYAHINYAGEMRERMMIALKNSKALSAIDNAKERQAFISNFIKANEDKMYRDVVLADNSIVKGGAVYKEAMDAVNEVTFQQELGKVTTHFQQMINACPPLQLLFPFVRTPTNLLKDALYIRAPWGAAMNVAKALRGTDPEQTVKALGQLTTACILWSSAYELIHSGRITGSGLANKKNRSMMMGYGWQPYSIYTEDGSKSYSLATMEPFGTGVMVLADFLELYEQNGNIMDEELAGAAVSTLLNFAANRTYFQGITGLLNEAHSGTGGAKWLGNTIASLVPNAFKDTTRAIDPTIYEARTWLDKVKTRVPGLQDDLVPKVGWVEGHPLAYSSGGGAGAFNPMAKSDAMYDAVYEELSKAGGISDPPQSFNKVKLTPQEYADLCQTHGTIKIDGKTMYEALREVITSDAYDINRLRFEDPGEYELDERRNDTLRYVVKEYRKAAQKQFFAENPQLKERIENASITDASLVASNETNFDMLKAVTNF